MILSPVRQDFRISQGFGQNPSFYEKFGIKGHSGQDIACPTGTPIYSPIDGTAEFKDQGDFGYGKYVRVTEDRTGACRQILLAHLSKLKFKVNTKQKVVAGSLLGLSGNTGNSTNSHLHWSYRKMKDGKVLNYDNGYHGRQNIFEQDWIVKNEPSKY